MFINSFIHKSYTYVHDIMCTVKPVHKGHHLDCTKLLLYSQVTDYWVCERNDFPWIKRHHISAITCVWEVEACHFIVGLWNCCQVTQCHQLVAGIMWLSLVEKWEWNQFWCPKWAHTNTDTDNNRLLIY